MHDSPPPEELIEEAATAEAQGLAPGFAQKVAANARAIAAREMALGPAQDEAEMARLETLVGADGDLAARNRRFAWAIRDGAFGVDDAEPVEHLILTTIAKMEVDQPAYPAFRRWQEQR